jgi:hypothetical protein
MDEDFFDDENIDTFDEENLFTQETYDKIVRDKRGEPSKYHSHWECDEEDIEGWTQVKKTFFFFINYKIFFSLERNLRRSG